MDRSEGRSGLWSGWLVVGLVSLAGMVSCDTEDDVTDQPCRRLLDGSCPADPGPNCVVTVDSRTLQFDPPSLCIPQGGQFQVEGVDPNEIRLRISPSNPFNSTPGSAGTIDVTGPVAVRGDASPGAYTICFEQRDDTRPCPGDGEPGELEVVRDRGED